MKRLFVIFIILFLINSCSQNYKILTKYPTKEEIIKYEVLNCKKYEIEYIKSKLNFNENKCIKIKKNKIYLIKCNKCK